jgi:ubiquinone/menaquinone biosynthesis C-methylase UbiE
MVRAPRPSPSQSDPSAVAMEAVQAGDLRMAFEFFAKAVNEDKRNASHRYNFALCAEQVGEIEAAAREYSNALHLNRNHKEAPRRLSSLLRRYDLNNWGVLDQMGLAAAFRGWQVDTQPLTHAALQWLKVQTQLGTLLTEGVEKGFEGVARRIVMERPDAILSHELLTSSLALGINKLPDVERLLTAVRRVLLLEAGPEKLSDRTLHMLTMCLAEHGLATGYVWMSRDDEDAAAAKPVDLAAVRSGNLEAANALLLRGLYQPLADICEGKLAARDANSVRPKAFRDLLVQHLMQAEEERRLAASLPRLGTVSDATSKAVASHYGTYPYPRWTNVQPTAPGAMRRALLRYFAEERLAFMDAPFDVLVAGCGTGHQAVDMALSFGPNAKVLGVDLSRPSLAYGQRIAITNGIKTVELAEADILDLPSTGRMFDMVFCAGVLHHMADPFAGWKALNSCLKPGGLQLIALYSAAARAELKELRTQAEYPGVACTPAQARAWRQTLMTLESDKPGGGLIRSQDFYSLAEFRDLVLHPSEHHMTIPQIETFLKENGLIFRGFLANMDVLAAYAAAYPEEAWPGSFASWQAFEQKNPNVFDGMYQFWCEKAV